MQQNPSPAFSRRDFLNRSSRFAAISATAAALGSRFAKAEEAVAGSAAKSGINHSVCKWCYKDIPLEDFCVAAKEIGLIDDTQELFYPAIMKAILETGYKGFVGQEFIPKRPDKLASLKQGVQICSV